MEAKNERAQFEAWLQPSMPRDGQIDEDGDFFYRDDWVQGAWIAWRHLAQQAGADPVRYDREAIARMLEESIADTNHHPPRITYKQHVVQQQIDLLRLAGDAPQPAIPAAEIFAAGWHLACDWAGREDLHSDEGSPAYEADRAARLAALVQSDKDRAR